MNCTQRRWSSSLVLCFGLCVAGASAQSPTDLSGRWQWISGYDWLSGEEELPGESWVQILILRPGGDYEIVVNGSATSTGTWSVQPCLDVDGYCQGQDVLFLSGACSPAEPQRCQFSFGFCSADCTPASVQPERGLQLGDWPDPVIDGGVRTYEWLGAVTVPSLSFSTLKARY